MTRFYLLLFLICLGCKSEIRNSDFIIYKNNNLCFKFLNQLYNDSVELFKVDIDGELVEISKVIDPMTFDIIANFKEDSIAIRNPFYIHNKNINIFKDKNYVYFLIDTIRHFENLKLVCKISEYKSLGGNYFMIKNEVFYSINKLQEVDISTFKTIDVFEFKSEFPSTLGIDRNSIFQSNQILKKSKLDQYHFSALDSAYTNFFKNP